MTEAERLSFAYIDGWSSVPSPAIERWIAIHGRLPTADDKPPGWSMRKANATKRPKRPKRPKLWAGWCEKPVKYGTGRREA